MAYEDDSHTVSALAGANINMILIPASWLGLRTNGSRSRLPLDSDCDAPAVGGQDCAVDKARVVRHEEADSGGDLLGARTVPRGSA
jgi:hypothetical protein